MSAMKKSKTCDICGGCVCGHLPAECCCDQFSPKDPAPRIPYKILVITSRPSGKDKTQVSAAHTAVKFPRPFALLK
ncbi:MAG: hypothetical protein Q9183_007135, partial [Haloplaca sp. 2 TL-2023]